MSTTNSPELLAAGTVTSTTIVPDADRGPACRSDILESDRAALVYWNASSVMVWSDGDPCVLSTTGTSPNDVFISLDGRLLAYPSGESQVAVVDLATGALALVDLPAQQRLSSPSLHGFYVDTTVYPTDDPVYNLREIALDEGHQATTTEIPLYSLFDAIGDPDEVRAAAGLADGRVVVAVGVGTARYGGPEQYYAVDADGGFELLIEPLATSNARSSAVVRPEGSALAVFPLSAGGCLGSSYGLVRRSSDGDLTAVPVLDGGDPTTEVGPWSFGQLGGGAVDDGSVVLTWYRLKGMGIPCGDAANPV
jgi:hypothetical protein